MDVLTVFLQSSRSSIKTSRSITKTMYFLCLYKIYFWRTDFHLIWGNGILIEMISHNYNMRGMHKYLIVHKSIILLHFPGIRQIGSDNEEFYCNSSRRRWKSNGRIQEVQVNKKEKWQSKWVEIKQVSKGGQVNKRGWRQGRIKHWQGKWEERKMELFPKTRHP